MNVAIGLLGTLLITVVGAFIGAFASSHFTSRRDDRAFQKERRLAAAEEMLESLDLILRMLRDPDRNLVAADWIKPIDDYYAAADDAWYILPPGLRHARRSVRAALGETLGVVAIVDLRPDLDPGEGVSKPDYWRGYAADYVSGVMSRLREWRDTGKPSVRMLDFDEWRSENQLRPEPPADLSDRPAPRV